MMVPVRAGEKKQIDGKLLNSGDPILQTFLISFLDHLEYFYHIPHSPYNKNAHVTGVGVFDGLERVANIPCRDQ